MRIVIFLLGFLILSNGALAKGCNTDLGEDPRVSDMKRIFDCLNNRINELEAKVGSSGSSDTALNDRMARLKRAAAGKNTITHRGVVVALEKCSLNSRGSIYCRYKLSNTTPHDKKMCYGRQSRLVTDLGKSFSKDYKTKVGSRESWYEVCDSITPLTTISSWVLFSNTKNSANSHIQFIRLDCGSGCTLDSFNIPIE